jgi:hypothetical protein
MSSARWSSPGEIDFGIIFSTRVSPETGAVKRESSIKAAVKE